MSNMINFDELAYYIVNNKVSNKAFNDTIYNCGDAINLKHGDEDLEYIGEVLFNQMSNPDEVIADVIDIYIGTEFDTLMRALGKEVAKLYRM